MDSYVFAVEGLDDVKSIKDLDPAIVTAARQAVNKTADRARARSARDIRRQVNFPASYVSDAEGRLSIVKKASSDSLEAVIRGRHRATSLARFISGSPRAGRGVRVQVKPGSNQFMARAFLIKLRAGNAAIDTKFNMGLAVRTDGAKPAAAFKPVRLGRNLWLLYGPSVDQVFRSVAPEIAPEMGDFLEGEFRRLLDLKR